MKIVVQPNIAREEMLEELERIEGVELTVVDSAEALHRAIPGADVLVISGHGYTREVAAMLANPASTVRYVQLLTAGYESAEAIGLPAKVVMANAGESWSLGVAEHAMALMLALVKCLPLAWQAQSTSTWNRSYTTRMGTLSGRTLVILGFGSIGREVARRAKAFDMHVIGVSRHPKAGAPADEVSPIDRLSEVLQRADFLVLALPSTPATRRIINAKSLSHLKPGAMVVNIARGDLIDTPALVAALESGHIAGAGIDATDPEPLPSDSPLWKAPNAIVTPHISGACGPEGRQRLARFVAANVSRYVAGEPPIHTLELRPYDTSSPSTHP